MNNVLASPCVVVDSDSDRRRRVGVRGSDKVLGVIGEETFEITCVGVSGVCVRDVNDCNNWIEHAGTQKRAHRAHTSSKVVLMVSKPSKSSLIRSVLRLLKP